MVETKIALFEGRKIRRHWDKKKDVWYFSVVDIISVLTSQNTFQKSRKYWNKLAERLRKEGFFNPHFFHRHWLYRGYLCEPARVA